MQRNRSLARSCLRAAFAALSVATIGTLAAPAGAAGDFIGFSVTNFRGASHGECSSSNLWWTGWMNDNIHDVFSDWVGTGSWDGARKKKEKDVDGVDFEDPAFGGDDDNSTLGCDTGDVCFLSTHGGSYFSGADSESYVYWRMGDNSSDCTPESLEMRYGNSPGDTEILIVDACESGQWGVWKDTNQSTQTGFFHFVSSTSTFSTFLGYHGLAPDRYAFIDNYARDVYSDGVGVDWLAEAYVSGNMEDNQDTCPVAIVFGQGSSNRDLMYEWGGMADRKNTGTRTSGATYYYIVGCDPAAGNPVNP